MVQWPKYLHERKVKQFWFEETKNIDNNADPDLPDLWELGRKLCSLGYAIRAVILDHADFVPVPRIRTAI